MDEKKSQAEGGEPELKYKQALEAIAEGSSWESVIANAVLDKKRPSAPRRVFLALGRNLAAITSLVVAISGAIFGLVQYQTSKLQKDKESRLAKVEAINKLIPSLTSENPVARRYALAALTTLYSAYDDDPTGGAAELRTLASDIGDAETAEAYAKRFNDDALKKKAAELYAVRAEHNRRAMETEDGKDAKEKDFGKVRSLQNATHEAIDRALALDPENAKAIYQLGVMLLNVQGDRAQADKKFAEVIRLIEGDRYKKDNEIYLRAHLRRTRHLYHTRGGIDEAVCESFRNTKRKYQEVSWAFPPEEEDRPLEEGCK